MKKLNTSNFDLELANPGVSIIDFYADWCGPCKQMEPALFEIDSKELASVLKVNIDEDPELAVRFGIRSIPTVILTKDGDIIDTRIGTQSYNALKNWIEDKT